MTAEHWASVDEVANHLGVAKDSVYRWIEQKDLPAHRMGRLWKFKISEVDAWVCQGRAAADPAPTTNTRKATEHPRTGSSE
ncbi:helix-turn-helix domain-containing protein [uncultured Thiocystis sp.]|uniref:helix-turn-helix domain-containing protein n=1 Tax=uncultured Thiocystis sp. TaxID=1202134 RepID=UPI0025DB7DF6|nr:helix-turn-helix domain-containing protein [uncultured Thiocystis sp.]